MTSFIRKQNLVQIPLTVPDTADSLVFLPQNGRRRHHGFEKLRTSKFSIFENINNCHFIFFCKILTLCLQPFQT